MSDGSRDRAHPGGTQAPRCPICGKPRAHRYRPFCSGRCRDVDLGHWFGESYTVPVVEPGYDDEDEAS